MIRAGLLGVVLVGALTGIYFFFFAAPSRILVPTTDITMVPPTGYEASIRFPGIEDTSTDGSFTVNSFPVQSIGSLGDMFASVERATPTLNNRGITVEGTEKITWEGEDVLLFRGTQKDDEGVLYEKWIAVFIAERPIMIAFQEPRPGKLSKQQLIDAFQSMQVNEDPF